MRLTLRTLLAYMDDVLDPDHAREIGNKVNASGNATALVNRIREVMRRRRLMAPELVGPEMGLDPNTVAEYLDSTLNAETVADVEKVCLDSDMHLAEIAACHQVLTIVLGEPVEVPARTRERMYALGSNRARPTLATDAPPPTTTAPEPERVPVKPVTLTPSTTTDDGFNDGVPDYLKPAPFWKRVLPIAIAALLIGGWAIMMYRELLGPGSSNSEVASNGTSHQSVTELPKDDSTELVPNDVANNMINEAGQAVPNQNPANGANQKFTRRPAEEPVVQEPGVPMNSVATVDAPNAKKTMPVVESTQVAAKTNETPRPSEASQPVTITKVVEPPTPKPTEPPKQPDLDASLPGPEFVYTSRSGRLVHRSASGWNVMPYRSTVRKGDRVCSPYPFAALFEIAELGLTIELLPGSSFEFAGATPKEPLRLDVQRGRVSIKRQAPENADSLFIGLKLAGEPCQIAMHSPQSLIGLEVMPREPNSFEMELGEDRLSGHLVVVSGDVNFLGTIGGDDKLGPQTWYSLAARDRKNSDPARRQTQLVVVPDWLDPNKPRMSATERTYAAQFEKKFDADLPLFESMSGLLNEKSQMLSTFAARALATTEMYPELVKALARAEFEETRLAAIIGLRQWLPLAPRHRELLKEELAKNFAADHVDPIYRLLWGYSDEDARSVPTSKLLVDWLHHENLVIRHLAFHHLFSLTGQKYDFRPVSPAAQRNAAIERWNMHLERNKGALLN